MADFQQHIDKALRNIRFLSQIRTLSPQDLDWQITVCFYIAVHLVNARIANEINRHPQTHQKTATYLNPADTRWDHDPDRQLTRLPSAIWLAYRDLDNFSRTSRYRAINDANAAILLTNALTATNAIFSYFNDPPYSLNLPLV